MTTGPERFIADQRKLRSGADICDVLGYHPYPFQADFHCSPAQYGFLGGSAGPGKTTCSLMELFQGANEFSADDAKHVHDLALRRTYPQLEATVITRFLELFPRELYTSFNRTKAEVVWLNGATLKFGSMQYESDAYSFQGQWRNIYYDELCDFTFVQWMATSAWNRCPVTKQVRKWGSGNPIGIGAIWVEDLFIKHVACMEMDKSQKAAYRGKDYPFFGATYLDNPIYANDPRFLQNLEAYPEAYRDALKFGIWGAAGGYFRGVYDEAIHVFARNDLVIKPWWKCLVAGTMVAAEHGNIPIEQVQAGDRVWTRKGLRRVLRAWKSGTNRDVVKATFSDGRTLVATPNHEVFANGQFCPLDKMSMGDRIELWNPDITKAGSTSSRPVAITRPRPSISIVRFGLRQMDRSPRNTISTTKTETERITNYRIWNFFRRQCTANLRPKESTLRNIAQRCLKGLRSGVVLQKEKSMSGYSASSQSGHQRNMKSFARDVAISLGRDLLRHFVPQLAISVGGDVKGWTIQPIHARYAESSSALIRPMQSKHAVGDADRSSVWLENLSPCGKSDVYDLAVEDAHEFYANGVLVHNCWISGNWGFAHPASYYKHCMDDAGVVYTYDELFEREKEPEELARIICEWAEEDGEMPKFTSFAHSFDAAATKRTATMGENPNSVNQRMMPVLRKNRIPDPHESTRDKLGRDTLMREKMRSRIRLGEDAYGHPLEVPSWQIADRCTALRRIIPVIKANPTEPEKMETTTDGTDSPLQGAGYGLYDIFGRPAMKPKDVQKSEFLELKTKDIQDLAEANTMRHLQDRKFEQGWASSHVPRRNPVRWRRHYDA